jgi:hypothetical protein
MFLFFSPQKKKIVYWKTAYINNVTPWSRVLLEKLTIAQLAKKFFGFYGTIKLITVFQEPIIGASETDESNPHSHILFI